MLRIGCHLSSSRGYLAMGKEAEKIHANTFQFFTIPIGYFLGGALTDKLFEPIMEIQNGTWLNFLFGQGKGSGASMYMFVLGVLGIAICLILGKIMNRYKFVED